MMLDGLKSHFHATLLQFKTLKYIKISEILAFVEQALTKRNRELINFLCYWT
jgi:hypothetical protein